MVGVGGEVSEGEVFGKEEQIAWPFEGEWAQHTFVGSIDV